MLELNFKPFPTLETERLILRKLVEADAPEIFFLRSDDQVLQYIDREKAKSIKEAEEFIEKINKFLDDNESILWGLALKTDPDQLIGTICFWNIRKEHYRSEIGFVLHPLYWRKGLMKEALDKVIEYGFDEMHLHSIDANVNPENEASCALLKSAGFVREGYFRENYFFNGKFTDSAMYSRLQTIE